MTESKLQRLARAIAAKVASLRRVPDPTEEADYDQMITRVIRGVPALRAEVRRNQARVDERYADLIDQPQGRRDTVLRNSPPSMLLALAYDLIQSSHASRFDNPKRSLALAALACETAEQLARTSYLSAQPNSDLLGEALGHLGNARRINSDVLGAERALAEADRHLERGSRDRALRAKQFGFRAALCHTLGQAAEAARFWDREVALRRLLGDPEKLGVALIDRGLVACWVGDLDLSTRVVGEGIELITDTRMIYLGLVNLAEAFAREGHGADAWKLLCVADLAGGLTDTGILETRHRWAKAITYRAMGQPGRGERLLREVVNEFLERDLPRTAAIASVDLLAICVAQGKSEDALELAGRAYATFVAEKLETRALSVFLILHRAARARALSESLAVEVANFIARYQHNRSLQFERSDQ